MSGCSRVCKAGKQCTMLIVCSVIARTFWLLGGTGVKIASFGKILIDCKHQKRCPDLEWIAFVLDTLPWKPIKGLLMHIYVGEENDQNLKPIF